MARFRIAIDLADLATSAGGRLTTLAWGDELEEHDDGTFEVVRGDSVGARGRLGFTEKAPRALVLAPAADGPASVLRLDFVDVQQGDATVIETPGGQVVLVDGGENQLFARYLATRYPGSAPDAPRELAAIVVTHGDADHFAGLSELRDSERHVNPLRRLFAHPARVFHNGLVKRPSKAGAKRVAETALFGATAPAAEGALLAVELADDLRGLDDAKLNTPFRRWKRTLDHWTKRGSVEVRRLEAGQGTQAFGFLASERIQVEVLGPTLERAADGRRGLRYLGTPASKIGREPGTGPRPGSASASHTINGHSVILRLTYGDVRVLLAGDLNEEAEHALSGRPDLASEVFKVPHHGSADFSGEFLRAVAPVVSIVSSGDESAKKEYIHPRATLMGALGRHGRASVDEPLVFVTELAAFFQLEGWVRNDVKRLAHKSQRCERTDEFFAFSRKAYGIVKVRTDGKRLLVYTYSGKDDLKEAYAFEVTARGVATKAVRSLRAPRKPAG